MCWGDICLLADENNREYLEFTERQTKTRSGEKPRDVRLVKPKMWANTENEERCPIRIYKEYARRRPINFSKPEHPFYIATTTVHLPSPNDTWFKRNSVGVNKLGSMLKRMVQHSGMNQNKRLSNHRARVPRGSVVKCLTRNPGVLGSSLTGSSGFFRGSVLGQDTSEPSLVLVKPRKA